MCREDARSRAQKSPPLELEDGIVGSIDEELAKCDTKVPLLSHFVRRLAMSDVADEASANSKRGYVIAITWLASIAKAPLKLNFALAIGLVVRCIFSTDYARTPCTVVAWSCPVGTPWVVVVDLQGVR
ncbi:hypothetical protein RI054_24g104060 [Pseudoscourfieldia marina]